MSEAENGAVLLVDIGLTTSGNAKKDATPNGPKAIANTQNTAPVHFTKGRIGME